MTPEEIQKLVTTEVAIQLKKEKENLSGIVDRELLYTGEKAKAWSIMIIFQRWVRT
jgi:hypothetical protein